MKKTVLGCALALCATAAFAQAPPPTEAQPSAKKMGMQKLTATVVSTDASGQQITVRNLSMGKSTAGSTSTGTDDAVTLKVEGKAVASLSSVKAGDSITVSCKPGPSAIADQQSSGVSGQALADERCASVVEIGMAKTAR
jgi:hypothetical protein